MASHVRGLSTTVLILAGMVATACSQSTSAPTPSVAQGPLGGAVDGGSAPTAPQPLTGQWVSDCIPDGSSGSGMITLTFTDTTLTNASAVYADLACTQLSTTTTTVSGYILSDTSPAGPDARDLDVTPQSATLAIHDTTTLAAANANALYGYKSWVADEPQDITTRTLAGATQTLAPPFYTVVENDGNKLYLGQKSSPSANDSTPAGRDTQLDSQLTYFRQTPSQAN